VTGLAVFVKFIRIQVATKEREKNMIKEKLETELKFLRNQTNPHFLMNTLNNIYALARKKSDETPEVVMKLSELLRIHSI
jgi:sensor histidine kinase YesM